LLHRFFAPAKTSFPPKKKVNKDEHCMTTLTNCLRGWKWMGFAGGWCKDSGWTSCPEPKSNLQVKWWWFSALCYAIFSRTALQVFEMQIPRQQQLILSLRVCVCVWQPNIRRKLGYNLFGQSRKLLHFDGTSSINRAHNCTCYNLVGFLNGLAIISGILRFSSTGQLQTRNT